MRMIVLGAFMVMQLGGSARTSQSRGQEFGCG